MVSAAGCSKSAIEKLLADLTSWIERDQAMTEKEPNNPNASQLAPIGVVSHAVGMMPRIETVTTASMNQPIMASLFPIDSGAWVAALARAESMRINRVTARVAATTAPEAKSKPIARSASMRDSFNATRNTWRASQHRRNRYGT